MYFSSCDLHFIFPNTAEADVMVRKVSISPEYPCEPDGDAAILDDEFRFADAIPPRKTSPPKNVTSPPRNLAGIVADQPVTVKSRRSAPGRLTSSGRSASSHVRKQITVFLAHEDWRLLREEAARRRISLSELCRQCLRPQLEHLDQTTSSC